jgi:predicted HicB family RNase H-like nuclease
MQNRKSAQLNIRVQPVTLKVLIKLAKKQGISQSDVIETLIRQSAKRQKIRQ